MNIIIINVWIKKMFFFVRFLNMNEILLLLNDKIFVNIFVIKLSIL